MNYFFTDDLPQSINTINGIVCNPTAQDLLDAGWTLQERPLPPTNEEIEAVTEASEAAAAAVADLEAKRLAYIQALREAYASATAQVCQICGLEVCRVLTMTQATEALTNAPEAYIPTLALLAAQLTNIENKLCRLDGNDALDRI